VEVNVYQGENKDAMMNTLIGRFMLEDLSDVPAGNELLFHLHLDINGILQVTAEEKRTGTQKSLVIRNAFNPTPVIDLEEARQRLGALKAHGVAQEPGARVPLPSPKQESPAISWEVRKEAEALLERGRRVLEHISADDRLEVIDYLEGIKEALERGDRESLVKMSEDLKEILFYLA